MIEAKSLSRSFSSNCALDDVSFQIETGEVVGFLGPNGAGKSTAMKILAGTLRPDAGNACIAGHDVVASPAAAKANLGYMPEAASGFGELTVAEFLLFCANCRGVRKTQALDAIGWLNDHIELAPAMNEPISTLSKGWRQRAWFAQAVLHRPPALILDEPTDGLDPNQKAGMRDFIREIAKKTAIFFSTHILEEAEELCDRIIILREGNIVSSGVLNELTDEYGRLGPAFAELTQPQAPAPA